MNNKNNALLIVDMQQEDSFVLEHVDTVVANAATLLHAARRQRMPVISPATSTRPTAATCPR